MSLELLLSTYQLGPQQLQNRMVMAPMTRARAGAGLAPTALNAEYYAQRASAGLIITEGSQISPLGYGWHNAPGIHTPEQIAGWQLVTDAVHAGGGKIFLQLWHTGRVSHPSLLNGQTPVSSSAVAATGEMHVAEGKVPYVTPRPLSIAEIKTVVQEYAQATMNSRAAGFDGVEIHGANGYLVDQFLRDGVNKRTDDYGGSARNRARFLVEVTEAVCHAWEPSRVGVRFSPRGSYNDMSDSAPEVTFPTAVELLNQFALAYVHTSEPLPGHPLGAPAELPRITPLIRQAFRGTLIINGGYDAQSGEAALKNNEADLIAYGVPFLANPDLPARFATGAQLNPPDYAKLYGGGAAGYTDYPTLK
jgi:N-ethylmaleimide reductase